MTQFINPNLLFTSNGLLEKLIIMVIITGLDLEIQISCHSLDLLILPTVKHLLWEQLTAPSLAFDVCCWGSRSLHSLPGSLRLPKSLAPSPVSAFPFSCWPLVQSGGVSKNTATKHRQCLLVASKVGGEVFSFARN